MPEKSKRRFEYIAIIVLGVLLRLPFLPASVDDAFITFRYARNLGAGHGFVFNPGEYILGTTTPFYTLYLAFWGSLGLDFITIGKLTNIIADTAGALILFIIIERATNRTVAWISTLLILCSPYNLQYSASGMETGIYTFLILWIFYLYAQKKWGGVAIIAPILVLVRPDGLLALLVIALFWLFIDQYDWRTGIKYAFLASILILPWLLFATWYFGSPIPHSIQAKALTYRVNIPFYWFRVLWHTFAQQGGVFGSVLLVILLGAGSLLALRQPAFRPFRPYLVWLALYIIVFTFFESGRFGWYYAPVMPVLFTLVVVGAYATFLYLQQFSVFCGIMQTNLRYFLAGMTALVLLLTTAVSVYNAWQVAYIEVALEEEMWQPIGRWIQENTPPEATVALESIGGVAWYSERYIWDEGGLVSAKTYRLNQETPGQINVPGILQAYRPDIYIAWQPWELETFFADPAARAWLEANYDRVHAYTSQGKTWVLFRLRDRSPVPTANQ